ncbi:Rieske (2Fe-2S) protein [Methanobacterium spitsbergense]|uniref:Rieske 2Fe-2S domain-containing protein n=1 Tax=Methanobacterium spitsbergense TaxID=2874285 RepID=A0A8T5URX4_9EURY|nr:Rieske 2Fe-2S domain-containing protein [Methanobacterium spitsbergense]MBZ2164877.1 Rieske 2Fe-2S domain-containing protein [Methanobacterium spitsbergense]
MVEFVEVALVDELDDGNMLMSNINGQEILVARVGDNYYGADNRCPHMGGNLSGGKLEGTIVTCPRHHSQFDLTDGHVIRWTDWTGLKLTAAKIFKSPRPLKTHQVKIKEDKIWVMID